MYKKLNLQTVNPNFLMEVSKTLQISANYRERHAPLNWDTIRFAEIVVIDKTHPASYPLLYQLNESNITKDHLVHLASSKSLSFSKDNFILVGNVLSIDKRKKHILLTDNSIVAYKLLVIAAGRKQMLSFHEAELLAALQILNDALRVKPKIPHSFPDADKKGSSLPSSKKNAIAPPRKFPKAIKEVVQPHIADITTKSFDLGSLDSRFYEVHT